MFNLVTRTWNPITGCRHECIYCWSRRMVERFLKRTKKYRDVGFEPAFHECELSVRFRPGELVFVSDMGDMFGEWVPREWILRVLEHISKFPKTRFLLLTKNPKRFLEFIDAIPGNCILGATIETNLDDVYKAYRISKAPPPSERIKAMRRVRGVWKGEIWISIEPILLFDEGLYYAMIEISPDVIYVGWDNYAWREGIELPEPRVEHALKLVELLRESGFKVICKPTNRSKIREKWRC